jgi:hypothetical protein
MAYGHAFSTFPFWSDMQRACRFVLYSSNDANWEDMICKRDEKIWVRKKYELDFDTDHEAKFTEVEL